MFSLILRISKETVIIVENIYTQNFFCTALSSAEKNLHLKLLQVGWDKCAPGYTYTNFRDMYIIHFVKSGYGTFETNGKCYNIRPNDAYMVVPNTLAIQTADSEEPWDLYFFAFGGELAKYLVEKTVFKGGKVSVTIKNNDIWNTIRDIAIELNENSLSEMHNLEYLFKMLSFFETDNSYFSAEANNYDSSYKYVYAVKKYISFNFSKQIKISDIAKQLNINRSHLYRIFKESTGKSINEYLVSTRINEARRLLDDTNFSTSAISDLVGYAYCSTFFKMFKNHTGLTPQEYRNKNEKTEALCSIKTIKPK